LDGLFQYDLVALAFFLLLPLRSLPHISLTGIPVGAWHPAGWRRFQTEDVVESLYLPFLHSAEKNDKRFQECLTNTGRNFVGVVTQALKNSHENC